jgi:hypothetical protein
VTIIGDVCFTLRGIDPGDNLTYDILQAFEDPFFATWAIFPLCALGRLQLDPWRPLMAAPFRSNLHPGHAREGRGPGTKGRFQTSVASCVGPHPDRSSQGSMLAVLTPILTTAGVAGDRTSQPSI